MKFCLEDMKALEEKNQKRDDEEEENEEEEKDEGSVRKLILKF